MIATKEAKLSYSQTTFLYRKFALAVNINFPISFAIQTSQTHGSLQRTDEGVAI